MEEVKNHDHSDKHGHHGHHDGEACCSNKSGGCGHHCGHKLIMVLVVLFGIFVIFSLGMKVGSFMGMRGFSHFGCGGSGDNFFYKRGPGAAMPGTFEVGGSAGMINGAPSFIVSTAVATLTPATPATPIKK